MSVPLWNWNCDLRLGDPGGPDYIVLVAMSPFSSLVLPLLVQKTKTPVTQRRLFCEHFLFGHDI